MNKKIMIGLVSAVVVIAALLFIPNRVRVPNVEIQAATVALDSLTVVGAAEYAPQALTNAQNAVAAMNAEVTAQNGKFVLFRSYKVATTLALVAKETADSGIVVTNENKAIVKSNAEAALIDARNSLNEAKRLVLIAPVGKGSALDIQMLQADVDGIELSLSDADSTMAIGKYKEALTKAQAVKNSADSIIADINNAISLKR